MSKAGWLTGLMAPKPGGNDDQQAERPDKAAGSKLTRLPRTRSGRRNFRTRIRLLPSSAESAAYAGKDPCGHSLEARRPGKEREFKLPRLPRRRGLCLPHRCRLCLPHWRRLCLPHWCGLCLPHWCRLCLPHECGLCLPHWRGLRLPCRCGFRLPYWCRFRLSHWCRLSLPHRCGLRLLHRCWLCLPHGQRLTFRPETRDLLSDFVAGA